MFARIKVVAKCYKWADRAVEAEFLDELTVYALFERLADLQAPARIALPPVTVDRMLDDQDVIR
ncbi:hypothetical protein LXN57_47195 [Actinoplanes sp. TRM88002]|uniref:Uncharacterized protein n=1 Tax=Paractinoplanes hotanensis TaxID=2906497 RepID=A0ABT0YGF7_9ACTN|nr:hypothetical protein [Actinoplanes hotanensis]MCM4085138.1 hypothetical protein [Actinoplanes hotanensis]